MTRRSLMLGALGVVFGDIGTSPLYTMHTAFDLGVGQNEVIGLLSLLVWTLTLIVSITYVAIVLRADHDGEGGILSLATLVHQRLRELRPGGRFAGIALLIGIGGACLFLGDGVITPAISVLSAVEGLGVVSPGHALHVVPITLVIIVVLFAVQRAGTGGIGVVFGPVMLLWFGVLFALGLPHLLAHPQVLYALLPTSAIFFAIEHPMLAFVALGAVVLSVTGAEALYADLGHFGASAIRRVWLFVAYPALIVNYLGQGALVLGNPSTRDNPFFHLAPHFLTLPLVVLATCATVIASQAVISGTYSVVRQAMRLGYLPGMRVRHTSATHSGQIEIPVVTMILFVCVVLVVVIFESSTALATAYGVAVTATFLLTTVLLLEHARRTWQWPLWVLIPVGVALIGLESLLFAANAIKIASGGWLPVVLAVVGFIVMTTWFTMSHRISRKRATIEGDLGALLGLLSSPSIRRVPGTIVFPHAGTSTAPYALRRLARLTRALPERIIIVRMDDVDRPYVSDEERVTRDHLGTRLSGLDHLTVRFGYMEGRNLPEILRRALPKDDIDHATFMLSHMRFVPRRQGSALTGWRGRLFIALTMLSDSPARRACLPRERTLELSSQLAV
ncbi:potassium transporter Kup [Devriesea agamarum]|uniref:potassium transporter Kup n=1 Tax=Devriesea agamarum TaxID=472569 RepID=UPI0018D45D27|nr:KUP/HAK/KT family potassium transporter [Devriesea agamarum]